MNYDEALFALFWVAIIVGLIALVVWCKESSKWEKQHPCIRSHKEKRWFPETVILIDGFPHFIPGYWSEVEVCDERK